MKSINPATNQFLKQYEVMENDEVLRIIEENYSAFLDWKKTDFEQRAQLMLKAAQVLKKNKEKYARLISDEMGKLLKEAVSEVEKCALVCEFYAQNAAQFLADEEVEIVEKKSFICYRPLGAVLAVMPWNYPMWQVFRFAVPALMAGNSALLKHASNVCGVSLAIEEVFAEAGFPKNLFRSLLIKSDQVEEVIKNNKIRAVTLTGSVGAGSAVAALAGKYLKKTVLELGGSDPYIILEDADLKKAVEICLKAKMGNAGQTCIAAKRFIVVEEKYEEFLKEFLVGMKKYEFGNPLENSTNLAPMSSIKLRDELHSQVAKSIKAGAKCLLGGKVPEIAGAFYPATILVDVKKGMPAYDEELFGPVASIIKVKNKNEAIKVANDSEFGLGAVVFSKDLKKAERIAIEEIEAGSCFVNLQIISDPRLPFGGIKNSGFGRELSAFGIREFVNVKTVCVG